MTGTEADRLFRGDPARGRRADIQGLRAVAVVLVVLFHSDVPGFRGGFIGVDVFFVISGYVIGGSLFREIDRTGSISIGGFFARRVRRLLPAFVAAAIGGLALTTLFLEIGDVQRVAASTALFAALFASNLFLYVSGDRYFSPSEELNPFLHTWSLGVEEQFYLVVPFLLLALIRCARSTRWSARTMVIGAVGLLTAASLWMNVWWVLIGAHRLAFFSPVSRFWEIGLGLLLASCSTLGRRSGSISTAVGLVGLALSVVLIEPSRSFPGLAAILPVVSTGLMLVAADAGLITRWLARPVAVWLGDRSYGWYLWHWPLVVVVGFAVGDNPLILLGAALLGLVPAAVSFARVERPAMTSHSLHLRGTRLVGAAGIALILVTAASSGVRAGANSGWGLDVEPLRIDNASHVHRCHGPPRDLPRACTFTPDGPVIGTILLFGDSHAAALSDGVIAAANRLGYSVTAYTQNNCPFYEVRTTSSCDDYRQATWNLIRDSRPVAVIVSHSTKGYVLGEGHAKQIRSPDGEPVVGEEAGLEEWTGGIAVTSARLSALDIALISIDSYPRSNAKFGDAPTVLSPSRTDRVLPLAELSSDREPFLEAEHLALPRGASIDVAGAFCDAAGCRSTSRTGRWLYYDSSHLNRAGSLLAADAIESGLRRILTGRQLPVGSE